LYGVSIEHDVVVQPEQEVGVRIPGCFLCGRHCPGPEHLFTPGDDPGVGELLSHGGRGSVRASSVDEDSGKGQIRLDLLSEIG
jgi:hypothetical protein